MFPDIRKPVTNSNMVPAATERFEMPTAESTERLKRFLGASKLANHADFAGLVLLSLCCYVDDSTWNEALCDAVESLEEQA